MIRLPPAALATAVILAGYNGRGSPSAVGPHVGSSLDYANVVTGNAVGRAGVATGDPLQRAGNTVERATSP